MMIGAPEADKPTAVIVPMGERAESAGQRLLADLRRSGIAADMAYRGNMKKRLGRANDAGAAYALIIGDDELDRGEAQLKNLATGEQRSVGLGQLSEALRS
jgi:histidyl-tRNA synthetase